MTNKNGSRNKVSQGSIYLRFGKRMLDLLLILFLFPVAVPLALIVSVVVWTRMGRPIFFRQNRPGFRSVPFVIYKFRTMLPEKDSDGIRRMQRDRVSPFGDFLRSTSLDELPELYNVLRGEMSLVGPRPLLMRYLERYTPDQRHRQDVKPGITGWAQIHGRNDTTWEQRFANDLWYAKNVSFSLDVRILLATLKHIVRRDGGMSGAIEIGEYMGPSVEPKHDWEEDPSDRPSVPTSESRK